MHFPITLKVTCLLCDQKALGDLSTGYVCPVCCQRVSFVELKVDYQPPKRLQLVFEGAWHQFKVEMCPQ